MLKVKDLQGYYKGKTFGIVRAVLGNSLNVYKGDMIAIAGESGSGKSTFAELLTGTPKPLLFYESGIINVQGYEVYETDKDVLRTKVKSEIMSYVPQASLDSLNPVKRIIKFISDVVKERTGERMPMEELEKFAGDHFERVGLNREVIYKYPHELSGGMKQRTVIAVSTMWNPRLLILDEPTSALDVSSQKLVIKMLHEMYRDGIMDAFLFVSHDISSLYQICNRLTVFYAGQIVEYGGMEDMIEKPLHPYTELLTSSVVAFRPDGKPKERLASIEGNNPNLKDPPKGCRFNPRCPKAFDKCYVEEPPHFKFESNKSKYERSVKCWLYEGGLNE